jgi:hypothetical protein
MMAKLSFVQKYEVLTEWQSLKEDRIRDTGKIIEFECKGTWTTEKSHGGFGNVLAGAEFVETTSHEGSPEPASPSKQPYQLTIYDLIVTASAEDSDNDSTDIPPELRFSDAKFHTSNTMKDLVDGVSFASINKAEYDDTGRVELQVYFAHPHIFTFIFATRID